MKAQHGELLKRQPRHASPLESRRKFADPQRSVQTLTVKLPERQDFRSGRTCLYSKNKVNSCRLARIDTNSEAGRRQLGERTVSKQKEAFRPPRRRTSPAREVERVLPSGITVKLKLEPLGGGRVRIVEYHRRAKRGRRFVRGIDGEGHSVAFERLGLEQSYEALFGRTHR